jgi:hypothetical protein
MIEKQKQKNIKRKSFMNIGEAYVRIHGMLNELTPVEAITLIERIGKEIRRKNSINVNKIGIKSVIDSERIDLLKLKENG